MPRFIVQGCTDVRLTIRAAKCAVLSHEPVDITLENEHQNQVIVSKEVDKYLGVDVDHNGIHWWV
jgi:hypothetical protein